MGSTEALDWDWHFAANAEPKSWQFSAECLMSAANVLWDEFMRPVRARNKQLAQHPDGPIEEMPTSEFPDHGLAALLLSGYAIENILKGIRLRHWQLKGENAVVDGKLATDFTTHRLKAYTEDAAMPGTSDTDKDVLLRLQQCIEWTGKYPVSTDATRVIGRLGLTPFRVLTSQQCDDVQKLYARLKQFYEGLG